MKIPRKLGISSKGKPMHYSVGAIIKKKNKYLLIDRATPPFGFASVAGHVDENETPEIAIIREVKEESKLKIKNLKLLFEEECKNTCHKEKINVHYWYVYSCDFEGEPKKTKETKSIDWYSKEEIRKLKLEPIWEYFFKKLKVL